MIFIYYVGMKGKLARLLLATTLLLLYATPEALALTPLNEKAYYRISWNGMGLGRVRLDIHEQDGRYSILVDTKSKGVINLFSPFETITSAEGIKRDGLYIPSGYHARAIRSNEGKNREVNLIYDETGAITERTRTPLDDPSWRPEVPIAELNRAPDPATAFLRLREDLFRNVNQGIDETTVTMYDGRRYAGMTVKAIQAGETLIDGKMQRILHTIITRQPINGYTPKEWKKYKKGDPTVYVWFSADETFLPLKLEISLLIGRLRIQREEED
jgi:hypothetical protein